ncbi:MAG: hypothetical protein J6K85_02060 [Clostridia bacterium]|nr:hypothetical protein [Clostridia bacterium]
MKNKIFGILLSLSVLLSVLFTALLPIVSYADEQIIYIGSAREFLDFAEKCSFDAWSKGKSFALSADISLEGENFSPIPSFSGTFDGKGYTISGVSISNAYSPAGLFSTLSEGGVITNLKVEGAVTPEGEGSFVGGIVGDNSGTVSACVFTGTVIGKSDVGGIVGINRTVGTVKDSCAFGEIIGDSRTGGIAGSNEGLISSSLNKAKVNTISVTPELTLDELNVSLTLDISKLPSLSGGTVSDTGGIAGYSTGIIIGCENSGEVGYKHIGYNVGGIAGRSSGHLASSKNSGNVYGRKDVGGIVGQMEPYISYNLSEDLLASLKAELDSMSMLINDAASSADEQMPALSERIDKIIGLLGDAGNALDGLFTSLGYYADDLIYTVNRTSNILSEVVSQISDVTAPLLEISESVFASLESLEAAIESLDEVSSFGKDALADMQLAIDAAALAAGNIASGVQNIQDGIKALSEAVVINDEAAVTAALTDITSGLTELSSALGTLSGAMSDISDALQSGELTGDKISNGFAELSSAFSAMSDGISKVTSGVEAVTNNASLDFTKIGDGLTLIGDGLGETANAAEHIEDTLIYLSDTIEDLEGLSDALDVTVGHAKTAISKLSGASDKITEMLTAVNSLVDYLDGVNPVQIPLPSRSIKLNANKLFFAMSDLETEMSGLNAELTVIGGDITDTVRKMNDSFSNIYNNIFSMIYGLNELPSLDNDVSEDEIESITNGKIFASHNSGSVYGDINVGGISGAMGLEYALDPEDDMSGELSITQKKQYQLKAVIHECINNGDVTAKRDSVGGVVGKMDFGTVYLSESYADISSEAGGYIGGIAGISAGRISACFAKGSLSGGKYVGGIVGSGVSEDLSGDSSLVKDCYSMVKILAYKQYAGGIAGANAGEFSGNYFVSDTLAGIDRVSYQGKAEPLSYEDLVKKRSIPDAFSRFTLDFIADGEVIRSVDFGYGESFDESVFPEIPEKDGHYGYWESVSLENLIFDTKVSVIYKSYVTAIGSDDERDGKHIFLVEGEFTEVDELSAESYDSLDSSWLKDTLFLDYDVLECWKVNIPSDDNESHNIHFLPSAKGCKVYLVQNGTPLETEVSELGSYLTFDANGNCVEIIIVGSSVRLLPILLISIGGLALIAIIITLAIIFKRRKAKVEK